MRACVLINNRARRLRRDRSFLPKLRELFADYGIEPSIVFCARKGPIPLPEMNRAEAIVAVGGDGTTSTVARIALERSLPLGVIPAGTHNHFARDLNIPLETPEAVRCIAAAKVANVDLGEVNGSPFINNSSIGAYPRAVEERDELIDRYGLRKSIAQLLATVRVFACRPLIRASIEIDGQVEECATPFVFVGNNEYQLQPLNERFRETLQGGQLCLFTTEKTGLGGFLRLFWLSLLNRLECAADFHTRLGRDAIVHLPRRFVRVSKDGEVLRLESPLHYAIRPKALPVILP